MIKFLFWLPSIFFLIVYWLGSELFVFYFLINKQITPFKLKLFFILKRRFFLNVGEFLFHVFGRKKGEQLMARIFALKTDQVQEFEPDGQEDIKLEERTVFLCKFLDVSLSADISDEVYTAKGFGKKREELLRAGTQELKILRRGLVGWKRFTYDDGTEVKWEDVPKGVSYQKVTATMDRNLNRIPPEIRSDIADFIRGSSSADQD